MYSITKGYVKSQEDATLLIKQISGRESIYQVGDEHWSFGKKKAHENTKNQTTKPNHLGVQETRQWPLTFREVTYVSRLSVTFSLGQGLSTASYSLLWGPFGVKGA